MNRLKIVLLREVAHVGGGASLVFVAHWLVNPIAAAIFIELAVFVGEIRDVTHGDDPVWKAILDAVAWAFGLALGVLAAV